MTQANPSERKKFSGQFWLVILFEFFERGSYYGMMSFISVYFVNVLHFPKENVGVIKGVIQPLLYFLPILSGALADRFGFRRLLMIAFTLLGSGYFLTSQATSYGAVFAALVIMGVGAGIFKPLISGSIAKLTDENNSTLGFGIYYWSINIGAFLFPLFLVPFLKAINPTYVILASAICTAAMLIPTALFFKDPVRKQRAEKREQTNLIQTLANAFEIIYSPIVLVYHQMKGSRTARIVWGVVLVCLLLWSGFQYAGSRTASARYSRIGVVRDGSVLIFDMDRNMLSPSNYALKTDASDSTRHYLTLYKPSYLSDYSDDILAEMQSLPGFESATRTDLESWIARSDHKIVLEFIPDRNLKRNFIAHKDADWIFSVHLDPGLASMNLEMDLTNSLRSNPELIWLSPKECKDLLKSLNGRPFFMMYVLVLIGIGLGIVTLSSRKNPQAKKSGGNGLPFAIVFILGGLIWLLPGIGLLGRIIASVIYLSITSLFIIDSSSQPRFADHARFLLMIFLYSGFWVLYFQMFDSVLWYVQAYVDGSSLNLAVNKFLGLFGLDANWFFDVEHVTVINAGTIILLQLWVSSIVKTKKALPTMMFGILLGTIGMAILAINTSIWVFVAGIVIFSLGEMTAHPKFISYIGLVAPQDRKAMYMGYLFLYGVFGSSIGGIVGAKLYVHFVDNLNQPRTLWLVFSGIGVFTIAALALYNRYLSPKEK
jgi:dipeptide/tripeptide permease